VQVEPPGPAAGVPGAFEHGDAPPRTEQVEGGREPREPGTDDHDVVGAPGHAAAQPVSRLNCVSGWP
jgi:hypothetical protein